jgi:outer membrane protein
MTARQRTYEKDAAYFQQQVEKRTISEESAKVIYADLMKSQEQLLALRDRYTEELSEQEFIMNERFVDSVYTYLKRYQEDKGYDYILGFSRGSGILYAKDTLDITWDVIRGMNESYQA